MHAAREVTSENACNPSGALVLASDGAFYGTTRQGARADDHQTPGTIFKVTMP